MLYLSILSLAVAGEPAHLTVDEALAALEAHHPGLARARAQAAGARGGTWTALSGTLPSVSATGSYTRNNEEVELDLGELFDVLGVVAEMQGKEPPEAPDPMVMQPLEALSGTIAVKVPLVAPQSWAQTAAAGSAARAAEASVEASLSAARATALQAFWSAGAAEAFVAAQDASVERARALVASADAAVRAGTSTRLQLLQAQTDLARREGDALQARATLEKARVAVGAAIGSPDPVIVELPEAPAPAGGEDAAVAEAWGARAEVKAAELALESARAQLTAVYLSAAPTLSGSFAAFASDQPYVTGEYTGWKGTVDLSWPLVVGGARVGQAMKARAGVQEAEAALDAAKLQVAQQVRAAQADVRVAAARVEVAGRQRALAEEGARVAQRSFDEGVVDSAAVLDALDRLDLARAAAIDAHARMGIADAALRAALGRW